MRKQRFKGIQLPQTARKAIFSHNIHIASLHKRLIICQWPILATKHELMMC